MQLSDLPTPQVLIDHTRAMNNIERVQQLATSAGLRLRPHAKTHKSPVVANWQIDRGAVGICCAKLGEAEVFADAGIADIRLPYPVNPSNAPRVLALMDRASISIIVDHLGGRARLVGRDAARRTHARRAHQSRRRLSSLRDRSRDADPLGFIQTVASLPGLKLRGLLSHAGHGYHAASEEELAAIARQEAEILAGLRERASTAGIALDEISVGATPTLRFSVRADRDHRTAPGQLRLLRSHAGRPRRRGARRLRAHRAGDRRLEARQPTGSSSTAAARRSPTTRRAASRRPPATARCWPARPTTSITRARSTRR